MRVGLVNFSPHGGMSHYLQNFAGGLHKYADVVAIVSDTDASIGFVHCKTHQYRRPNKSGIHGFIGNSARYLKIASSVIRHVRPDILHFVSDGVGLIPFVAMAKAYGVRTVLTVHDPEPHAENRTRKDRLLQAANLGMFHPVAIRLSSAIHVHSKQHREPLAKRFGVRREKVYVAQHGVGVAASMLAGLDASPKGSANEDRRPAQVLMFGRLEPYKGLDVLVNALEQMPVSLKTQLTLAGRGHIDHATMDRLKALNPPVRLIDRFVGDPEIPSLFAAADLVVLPYREATQSGVAALALAFGKPVVATDVGAIGELIRDNESGRLVRPNDPTALCSALVESLNATALQKFADGAHQISTQLSWERVAADHLTVYQELINGHTRTNGIAVRRRAR